MDRQDEIAKDAQDVDSSPPNSTANQDSKPADVAPSVVPIAPRRRRVQSRARAASTRTSPAVITLLTDFGATDYFVGAMKGVILSDNPAAQIVDITHDVPPQDIEAGAFVLLGAYSSFPAGTVHVAVVDPGVGSLRLPIVIEAGGQFFVGPDNGLFSYICERESDYQVFQLANDKFFRHPVSNTFHGRDVFAPVAAALSRGIAPAELGPETKSVVRLDSLVPERKKNGKLKGRIINIDRFGNCVTNFTEAQLSAETIEAGAKLLVNGKTLKTFRRFFAEEKTRSPKLFAFWGSAGFLEIAAQNHSAAKILKAKRGTTVVVEA